MTQGAQFKSRGDRALTEDEFYSALSVGMLVEIEDRDSNDVAEEVGFESEIKFSDDDFEDEMESGHDLDHSDMNGDSESDNDSSVEDDMGSDHDEDSGPMDPDTPMDPNVPMNPGVPVDPNAPV